MPVVLVVGERDATAGTVSPRRHKGKPEEAISVEAFLARVEEDVRAKRLPASSAMA